VVILTIGLFLLLALAGVVFAEHHLKQRRQHQRAQMEAFVRGRAFSESPREPQRLVAVQAQPPHLGPSADFFRSARHSPFDALSPLRDGDFDGARQALQKIAFMVHADRDRNPDLVQAFTDLMCKFVNIDPLFTECLGRVLSVIEAEPGVRQTALYEAMGVDTETARYVLYFAHETGHVVRRKKGNSYEVFLPGQPMPVEAPKKSTRKQKPKASDPNEN
jgi:hypothetical protein